MMRRRRYSTKGRYFKRSRYSNRTMAAPVSYGIQSSISDKSAYTIARTETIAIVSGIPEDPVWNPQRLDVNPGLGQFKWLAPIARNFELYKFVKLRFTWIPSVPTNFQGRLLLYFDYDAADSQPGDELEMANSSNCARGPLWSRLDLYATGKNGAQRWYYVRSGPPPPNTDLKTYDYGFFSYAFAGIAPAEIANVSGTLSCDYVIQFLRPCLQNISQSLDPLTNVLACRWVAHNPSSVDLGPPSLIDGFTADHAVPYLTIPNSTSLSPVNLPLLPPKNHVANWGLPTLNMHWRGGNDTQGITIDTPGVYNFDLASKYTWKTSTLSAYGIALELMVCKANGDWQSSINDSMSWPMTSYSIPSIPTVSAASYTNQTLRSSFTLVKKDNLVQYVVPCLIATTDGTNWIYYNVADVRTVTSEVRLFFQPFPGASNPYPSRSDLDYTPPTAEEESALAPEVPIIPSEPEVVEPPTNVLTSAVDSDHEPTPMSEESDPDDYPGAVPIVSDVHGSSDPTPRRILTPPRYRNRRSRLPSVTTTTTTDPAHLDMCSFGG